jgi:hypothetical protein
MARNPILIDEPLLLMERSSALEFHSTEFSTQLAAHKNQILDDKHRKTFLQTTKGVK